MGRRCDCSRGRRKGLMLPPGLCTFQRAISDKALRGLERWLGSPVVVWGLGADADRATTRWGFFPAHAGDEPRVRLRVEALAMLFEEGLPNVFARHDRHAEATRRAVTAWGLNVLCANPEEHSSSLTAVMMPAGHDADTLRKTILDRFDMSLGTGLGRLKGKVFPHRASRRLQRPDARRHAGRRRDGPCRGPWRRRSRAGRSSTAPRKSASTNSCEHGRRGLQPRASRENHARWGASQRDALRRCRVLR